MARNDIEVSVPPERVWRVLAEARLYPEWVVGAQEVEGADPEWPAAGARLRHRSGVGPLNVEDETVVEAATPDVRLVLRAKLGPVGTFRVTLDLAATQGGTRIVLHEEPVDGAVTAVPGIDAAVHARNAVSLERLKDLAEADVTSTGLPPLQ